MVSVWQELRNRIKDKYNENEVFLPFINRKVVILRPPGERLFAFPFAISMTEKNDIRLTNKDIRYAKSAVFVSPNFVYRISLTLLLLVRISTQLCIFNTLVIGSHAKDPSIASSGAKRNEASEFSTYCFNFELFSPIALLWVLRSFA